MNAITTTRSDWANKIAVMWGQARESYIEAGKTLISAKAALAHGEFESMIAADLPFGSRTARMLMQIARHPLLANRNSDSVFPSEWTTLYQLSRLEDATLNAALERGAITPDMQRKDAERLVAADRRTEKLKNIEAKAAQNADSKRTLDEVVEHVKANNRRYAVIYFDPPWKTYTHSEKGLEKSADLNHYPTMTDEEIAALPIDDLAHQDAILFLWSTANRVGLTVDLVRKWGFEITTFEVWDKVIPGTGHWHRDRFEPLYFCTRGNLPCPIKGVDELAESLHSEAKGPHSFKPRHFRDVISRYFPHVAKLELFARQETIAAQYPDGALPEGWDFWGNEMPLQRVDDDGELVDLGTGEVLTQPDASGVSEMSSCDKRIAPMPLPDIDIDACANCLRWAFDHRCGPDYIGRCQWRELFSEANAACEAFVPMMRDVRQTHLATLARVSDSGRRPPNDLLRSGPEQSEISAQPEDEQPSGAIDPDPAPTEPEDDPFEIPAFLKRGTDNSLPEVMATTAADK